MDLLADFTESLALLAALSAAIAFLQPLHRSVGHRMLRDAGLGVLFGVVILVVIVHPITLPNGATFDPRGGPAILAGVFAGPVGAAVAAAMGAAGRYYIVGGPFALGGAVGFLLYGGFGVGVWWLLQRGALVLTWRSLLAVGTLGTIIVLPAFFVSVDPATALQVIRSAGAILLVNNLASTLIVGGLVLVARRYLDMSRALAERRLEDAKLSLVARKTTNTVIITDATGRIEWVNEGFTRATGYQVDEVIGSKPGHLLQGPDTDPETVRHMSERLAKAQGFEVEILNYTKAGVPYWVEIRCQPIEEPGEPLRFIAIETDITRKKEALDRANRAEQTLLTAIESIEDAFVLFDADDRLLLANSKYKEYYPESADLLEPGMRFEDIIRIGAERGQYAEAVGRIDEWVAQRMEAHLSGERGVEQKLNDGRWLKVSERRMPDGGIVGFRVDVTELKNAREAAESASRVKSEFLASMSHEIRTPMTGVMGLADLLLDDDLAPTSKDKVLRIKDATNALLGIINDILDLSKLDARKLEIERIDFELKPLIEDVVALFRQTCPAGKIDRLEIAGEIDANLPRSLRGDPTRLRQILINLVGNGVKFTEEGSVRVTATCTPGDTTPMMTFRVSDSGIGIAKDVLPRLFEDFTQADASISRNYHGTGLGLAICKRLVTLMGGEIGVESETGAGSTFWFTIPFEAVADADLSPAAPPAAKPAGRRRPLSILVAEDAELNQMIIESIVAKLGHRTTCVADGAEAVAAVASGDYDLVLMDVRMPIMSGPDATRQIRRMAGPKAGIPIIALTADVMEENRRSYFEAGMAAFVPKPINPDELADAIDRAAAASAGGGSASADGDAFDLATVAAEIQLTPTQLAPLIDGFLSRYATAGVRLRDMIAAGRREEASRLVHEIAGIAGNLGASRLGTLAAELEVVLQTDVNTDPTPMVEAFSRTLDSTVRGMCADTRADRVTSAG